MSASTLPKTSTVFTFKCFYSPPREHVIHICITPTSEVLQLPWQIDMVTLNMWLITYPHSLSYQLINMASLTIEFNNNHVYKICANFLLPQVVCQYKIYQNEKIALDNNYVVYLISNPKRTVAFLMWSSAEARKFLATNQEKTRQGKKV